MEILACPACGLQWWLPPSGFRPDATYDAAYFASPDDERGYDDYGALEESLRRNFARRLRALGPPSAGARLLDVGTAYGFAVAEASRAGWQAFGLELSPAAARHASELAGRRIARADGCLPPFGAGCFDAVTLWDVLEHLPDPHAALAGAAELLKPGGLLALSTGDAGSAAARLSRARWHLYTLPEHLFFFTRRSLELLLEAHGLRLLSLRREGSLYSVAYLVERLRKTWIGGQAGAYAGPGAHWLVPVNLFDILTLTAVRR